MTQVNTSRRTLLGAGAAVLGVALVERLVVRDHAIDSPADGVRVVSGTGAPVPTASAQLNGWEDRVGERFQLAAETGSFPATLIEVRRETIGGKVPPGVRSNPFTMIFSVERHLAPAGDGMFTLDHAIEGLNRVFVSRWSNRGGRAILAALFA